MKPNVPRPFFFRLSAAIITIAVIAAAAAAQSLKETDWPNITPAEIAMKSPLVDPNADAEAIFWKIRIDDKKASSVSFDHHIRIKIFSERGREKYSKLDIPFTKRIKVENLAVRVIKPDGTIVNVPSSEIFTREILKASGIKVQAFSVAIPNAEVGSIIEYRYSEIIKNAGIQGAHLDFQKELPIQKLEYQIRPFNKRSLWTTSFNMDSISFVTGEDGFMRFSMSNVPALAEEPFMPPEDEVKRWAAVSYSGFSDPFGMLAFIWQRYFDGRTKPTGAIREKAAELTAGLSSNEEKARAIHRFIQTRIRTPQSDDLITAESLDENDVETPTDVLKKQMGSAIQADFLFAALTKAAGVDVKVVIGGDRRENFFSRTKYPFSDFVSMIGLAVNTEGSMWKFIDPCDKTVPFGVLPWYREGVEAMAVGGTQFTWLKTTMNSAAANKSQRSGNFTINADGTLEGDIRMEFSGQEAVIRKSRLFGKSPTEREEIVKSEIQSKLSTAEISMLSISGLENSGEPLLLTMKIRIPSYAQKSGRRILLQPNVFEYGSESPFSAGQRKYPIVFRYPWSEADTIAIKLGEGLSIDAIDSPPDVRHPGRAFLDSVSVVFDKSANTIRYTRDFSFANDRKLIFEPDSYENLKKAFDLFQKTDTHSLLLTQK